MLNDTSSIDSTDSSTSKEVLDEVVVSINSDNSNRKRKIHNKDHSSDNQVSSKGRKRVSFLEDQKKLSTTFGNQQINDKYYTNT